ncbi:MAG: WXG100 family type VII secretion target [Aquificales bacterium]|nr:WXG100 family type VII secretion target [Aquificales bacterium]
MNIIQCDYERLEQIAAHFGEEANRIEIVQTAVQNRLTPLENSGWVGRGADAFFAEIEQIVLPAIRRLITALAEADAVSQQIIVILKSAEAEASSPFQQPSESTPPPRIYIINGINSEGNITVDGQVIIGDDNSVAFERLLEQYGYDPSQVLSTPAIYTSPQTDLNGTNLHGTNLGGWFSPVDWLTDAGSWAINGVTDAGADGINAVTGSNLYQTIYNSGEVFVEYLSGDEGGYTQQLEAFIRNDLERNPLLPNQTVWLVGHSGGGAPAANLAGMLENSAGVDVSTVMTLGSPISNYDEAHRYAENIIQVRHEDDYIGVPYLRGGFPFQVPDYVTNITLTQPMADIPAAHGSYMFDQANSRSLFEQLNRQFPELSMALP